MAWTLFDNPTKQPYRVDFGFRDPFRNNFRVAHRTPTNRRMGLGSHILPGKVSTGNPVLQPLTQLVLTRSAPPAPP